MPFRGGFVPGAEQMHGQAPFGSRLGQLGVGDRPASLDLGVAQRRDAVEDDPSGISTLCALLGVATIDDVDRDFRAWALTK